METDIIKKLALLLETVSTEIDLDKELCAQTSLRGELGLDAAALLLFALAVEDEFDVRFVGNTALETLGDVANYICQHISKVG